MRWVGTLSLLVFVSCCAFSQEIHYSRFRDAKWYARQIQTLQDEIGKIDIDLRTLSEARKSGKVVTDSVALNQKPAGATSEAQMKALRNRRAKPIRQIHTQQAHTS